MLSKCWKPRSVQSSCPIGNGAHARFVLALANAGVPVSTCPLLFGVSEAYAAQLRQSLIELNQFSSLIRMFSNPAGKPVQERNLTCGALCACDPPVINIHLIVRMCVAFALTVL